MTRHNEQKACGDDCSRDANHTDDVRRAVSVGMLVGVAELVPGKRMSRSPWNFVAAVPV